MHKNILSVFHAGFLQLLRRSIKKMNPGTAYQFKALESSEEIEHDFADLEPDFHQFRKASKQVDTENKQQLKITRQMVVKQKYFHGKLPNFLTCAEKEQIRLLHNLDAEEWNTEKLSESFPATPVIVNKILQVDWRMKSEKRLSQHDKSVITNFELLRSRGFTNLPTTLKEHLLKFANRNEDNMLRVKELKKNAEFSKPKRSEFSFIVANCRNSGEQFRKLENLFESDNNSKPLAISIVGNNGDSYLIDKIQNRCPLSFQELKQQNLKSADSLVKRNLCLNDTLFTEWETMEKYGDISDGVVLKQGFQNLNENNNSQIEKFQSKENVICKEVRTRYEKKTVKDHIYIPRKFRSKVATYKFEDCYYDYDGEFLYRVLGMIGKRK